MRHYQAFSNMEDAMKWARKFKIEKVDRVGDVIMLGPMDDEQYIELISSISTAPLKSEK